jgi:hypothetical protein
VHPSRYNQSSPPNRTRDGSISPTRTISRYGISAQNSLLLHDLCRSVCEPQTCYMDAHTAVMLHFVLMSHTRPFRCASRITDFLENDSKSPNLSNSSSVRRLSSGFSYCAEWNPFASSSSNCKFLSCPELAYQKTLI